MLPGNWKCKLLRPEDSYVAEKSLTIKIDILDSFSLNNRKHSEDFGVSMVIYIFFLVKKHLYYSLN